MIYSVVIMGLMVLLLLAGVLPAPGGAPDGIFRSPVFILLCGVLVGGLVLCCWQRLFRGRRKIAFILVHLGVAMILVGAFIGFLRGRRTNVVLPLDGRSISGFQAPDQHAIFETGFAVAATNFEAEYYEPRYFLYRPASDDPRGFELVDSFSFRNGTLDLGDLGIVAIDELQNPATGEWLRRKMLRNGWILHRGNRVAKSYRATLAFRPENRDDAQTVTHVLEMNRPATYDGWRFYLMSYDTDNQRYVVVTMRRDPGRRFVITGVWMTIIGTVLICWRLGGAFVEDTSHAA